MLHIGMSGETAEFRGALKTYHSDKCSTDSESDDETRNSPRPDLPAHTSHELARLFNLVDIAVAALFVLEDVVAFELRGGRVGVDGFAGRHELLYKREQDRDDNAGFDRLTCLFSLCTPSSQ